ncbi:dUTP pyrophosphatase [Staphylococcus chromogenes]|uniref:dUTP diphosphatase n=1 Tax=Staphylococcus chromogenes TaxID=46126 RepID=A0AAX0ZEM2_STACR|nr:dUTP pyrophosphatase [Staphylococcus chromogenes]KDP13647.1 phage protein [Staphylococcus chromogenes MU 970]MBV5138859.1 dUTP pyrophosphatase [Staphylococcus chromogenes]MBW6088751.1 dUTP pyrophosphatase [Staphylococcus chromogenes]MCD9061850.1 dUTP pyrophosphatase [Staphylococcus chromogenes]MDU0430043.1 dUTP pyrophosphatase [Staphylococcus chromogenes]
MDKLQIKLLSENATLPTRNHSTDAGFDIYAAETILLEPQEKALIATDIAVNIPKGYVGLLTSRSGVSSKTHLVIETGKIDAGFHGNMKINIKNDHEDNGAETIFKRDLKDKIIIEDERHLYKQGTYVINKGERLAQLVIVPIWTPTLQEVDEFSEVSERGEKGFGSSGI